MSGLTHPEDHERSGVLETLRFFILSAHYRSPIDFSDQNLDEAQAGLERIYSCLAAIDETVAKNPLQSNTLSDGVAVQELRNKAENLAHRFREAMDDDFNTALALGSVFDTVRAINRFMAENRSDGESIALLFLVKDVIKELGGVLGLFTASPVKWLEGIKAIKTGHMDISPEEIERLITERSQARISKDFKRSDEIRDLLLQKGIQLLDSAQGTTWKIK